MYINPTGTEESIQGVVKAIYGARTLIAAKAATALFLLLTIFAFAYLGTLGLWALSGTAVFGLMWIVVKRRQKDALTNLRVGDLRGGDVDDTTGFARLNVALDDAIRGEKAGFVDESVRREIASVLSGLPAVFDFKDSARAAEKINELLAGAEHGAPVEQ